MRRAAIAWAGCLVVCLLCGGAARAAGPLAGLQRAFNSLRRAVATTGIGADRDHPLGAGQAHESWRLVKECDELRIYTRPRRGSDIREVKAVGPVDAPPGTVWEVIGDYDRYAEFMPYLKEARVVAREGDRVFYVYERISAPFVSDRDFTVKVTREPADAEGSYRAWWTAANDRGPAPREGVIRVTVNEGAWILEPLDGGARTRVTYFLYTDPGPSLPRWLANKGNTKALPKLFRAIARRARKIS